MENIFLIFYKIIKNKDQYIRELSNYVEKNDSFEIINKNYCEWKIENWNEMPNGIFEKEFEVNENKW